MTTTNLVRQEITITNQAGLHARPAAEFVRASKAFRSQIWIVKGEERFSAGSIMEVLTANLNCGDSATIEADGPDAKEAVKKLVELVAEFGGKD
ncbi:MAG TPA: HPr family phosphocarrier protein [Chthoniobacterales bacterium]|jgi:phosphotransferase system HPr (HPr) family protein|nr:HPr family phosphocarrier protein [Chthoniobacterales bacterium]